MPVVRDGRFAGIVDVRYVRTLPRNTWEATPAGSVICPSEHVILAPPEAPLTDVLADLNTKHADYVAVVEADGRLLGILSLLDMVRWVDVRVALAAPVPTERHRQAA